LSRLRHPDLLQISEPLEESRSELTFVTEAVTGSLSSVVKDLEGNTNGGSTRKDSSVEVDEVEVSEQSLGMSPNERALIAFL
jgi:SCY1-like protein 2